MKKIVFAVLISLVLVISMAGIAAADEPNIDPAGSGETELTYTADNAFTWDVPAGLEVNSTSSDTKVTITLPAVFPQDLAVTVSGEIKATDGSTKLADATSLVLFHVISESPVTLDADTKLTATLTENGTNVGITAGAFSLTGVKHTNAAEQSHEKVLKATLTGAVPKAGKYQGKVTYTAAAVPPSP